MWYARGCFYLMPTYALPGRLLAQLHVCFIFLQEEVQRKENSKVKNPARLALLNVQTVYMSHKPDSSCDSSNCFWYNFACTAVLAPFLNLVSLKLESNKCLQCLPDYYCFIITTCSCNTCHPNWYFHFP